MHEYGIVQSLVEGLLVQVKEHHIDCVSEVRFRRSSAFDESALLQGFAAASAGTPLAQAHLVIEIEQFNWGCPCGYSQLITTNDLIGHMFRCPSCSMVWEIQRAHDLKLIELVGAQGSQPIRLVTADEDASQGDNQRKAIHDHHEHPYN
jgi:Zn finger protein HypA/HybF involved in hydrogenase expression